MQIVAWAQETVRTPFDHLKKAPPKYEPPNHPLHYGTNYNLYNNVSIKYKFTVVLKNDSTFVTKAMIDGNFNPHTIEVKTKTGIQYFSPNDTKEIYRFTSTGDKIIGTPTDSCWTFPNSKGRINTYSNMANFGGMYAIAFQVGEEGPIKRITKDNLLSIMGDNPELSKLINAGKLIKAIEKYNTESVK
jgi:hypothetical protein